MNSLDWLNTEVVPCNWKNCHQLIFWTSICSSFFFSLQPLAQLWTNNCLSKRSNWLTNPLFFKNHQPQGAAQNPVYYDLSGIDWNRASQYLCFTGNEDIFRKSPDMVDETCWQKQWSFSSLIFYHWVSGAFSQYLVKVERTLDITGPRDSLISCGEYPRLVQESHNLVTSKQTPLGKQKTPKQNTFNRNSEGICQLKFQS